MSWTLYQFNDNAALLGELAPKISQILRKTIAERGRATLAVSGGSTPKPLFEALSRQDIPWTFVTVILVDERWVAPTHEDSNELLVRRYLLQNLASHANFIGMKTPAETPFEAEDELHERLAGVMPPDVAILGMGSDGHTASFLPGARGLTQAMSVDTAQLCCGIEPTDETPHMRMTLTLPALLSAAVRILYMLEKEKYPVLLQAMQPGPAEELPIRSLLHQPGHSIDIYYAETGGGAS